MEPVQNVQVFISPRTELQHCTQSDRADIKSVNFPNASRRRRLKCDRTVAEMLATMYIGSTSKCMCAGDDDGVCQLVGGKRT